MVSRDFKRVKMTLLHHLTNMGQPFIYVVDANYLNRGELYLAHQFNGLEVDAAKVQLVLENLRLIWGRPVHLQAVVNEDMFIHSMEEIGGKIKKERVNSDTPRPGPVAIELTWLALVADILAPPATRRACLAWGVRIRAPSARFARSQRTRTQPCCDGSGFE